jgi:uroporphyrinogen-III decarboxylase
MNLGHGILPDTPTTSVDALVEAVHAGLASTKLQGSGV